MILTCKVCDAGNHTECSGFAVYMDQDGPQNYGCRCHCRTQALAERDRQQNIAEVNLLIRHLGLDRTHKLVEVSVPEESMSECVVSEVIETLVKELDNHGYGDMHWFPREYRDPSVEAALAVGRAWLAAHQKEETNGPD